MQLGTISKLYRDKEYGTISGKNGEEYHFHKHCLWDIEFGDLSEGQEVEFEIQSAHKGFLSFNIRPHVTTKPSHKEVLE